MNPGLVLRLAGLASLVVLGGAFSSWMTQRRLVLRAESAIAQLRIDAFAQVHRLSVADHNELRRGVLVSRVTSDAEALSRFAQWGLWSWSMHPALIVGILGLLAWFSWQLALVVLAAYSPVVPLLRWLQRRQLAAYDALRTSVGDMLATFSEAVTGAAVVRAYGVQSQSRDRLRHAVGDRYRKRMKASRFMVATFVVGDLFGAVALAAVLVAGVINHDAWGIEAGELVACLFLTTLLNEPIAELGETLDQTQTAVAGWRKILDLLDRPLDVVEPVPGRAIPPGAIEVEVIGLGFAYRDADREPEPVLKDVTVHIPAGTNVAIVGETGSGKTTFAKLLCRLADPRTGTIRLNGVPLAEVDPVARLASVRMVTQDGFLFDTTIRENLRFGRPDATQEEIEHVFSSLGLQWWIDRHRDGLDARVGERGDNLSVGERQLVALARAALADPGLLILDEATSAVDPETDRALTTAIRRLARGRTLVSIAHRLATAEAADVVLVFDRGRLVEQGSHADLVARGGVYASLHRAWIGNTRSVPGREVGG